MRRVGEAITELFAHPGGWAARPMAHVLNFFNQRGNRRVASALPVRPGQRVLEVGFGGGAAIPTTLMALDPGGALYGVDLSPDMARVARRRFAAAIGRGALTLACADVAALPVRDETFDHAYAMHSHLYWPSPEEAAREIVRTLRPGGRLLLGMDVVSGIRLLAWFGRSYDPARPDRLQAVFREAGLVDVTSFTLAGGVVAVAGTKP